MFEREQVRLEIGNNMTRIYRLKKWRVEFIDSPLSFRCNTTNIWYVKDETANVYTVMHTMFDVQNTQN